MILSLENSPYMIIKNALSSRFNLHNALEKVREFRQQNNLTLQLDSEGNFLLSSNAQNNLIASSFNILHLGSLNYRICDFLNSSTKHEDSTVANELLWKLNSSEYDLEIGHSIYNNYIANLAKGDKKVLKTIQSFYAKHFKHYKFNIADKIIDKESYLTQDEILHLIQNALDDQCNEITNCTTPETVVLVLNEPNHERYIQNVAEGLNFVRLNNKPCIFMIKFHNLHCGVIVLPMLEVNKYKFIIISRSQNDVLRSTINKIRNIAFEYELLRDDFLISGQYIYFDYKFNANFDIKTLLSAIKILPLYQTEHYPKCTTDLIKLLEDWNNYSFSTIEEHLNYLYNYSKTFDAEMLRYSV